ncbi:MAG: hypothetical protein AB8H86_10410 [Polyangiales bacterium]
MRVRVLEVHGETHVRVACEFGEFVVASESNRYVVPGASADLEFDVDEVLELGRNAFVTEDKTYAVENVGSSIHMCGQVDGVDEDGLIYLRLDVACLTMIDAPPGVFDAGQWIRVELEEQHLRAYLTTGASVSPEARLEAFEERVGRIPSELVSLPGLGEYIAVHPCSDEVELLAKLGIGPESCTKVDCYWRVLGDVHFVQVMTQADETSLNPKLYARVINHGSWALNIVVTVEKGPISCALLKDALAGALGLVRSMSGRSLNLHGLL